MRSRSRVRGRTVRRDSLGPTSCRVTVAVTLEKNATHVASAVDSLSVATTSRNTVIDTRHAVMPRLPASHRYWVRSMLQPYWHKLGDWWLCSEQLLSDNVQFTQRYIHSSSLSSVDRRSRCSSSISDDVLFRLITNLLLCGKLEKRELVILPVVCVKWTVAWCWIYWLYCCKVLASITTVSDCILCQVGM